VIVWLLGVQTTLYSSMVTLKKVARIRWKLYIHRHGLYDSKNSLTKLFKPKKLKYFNSPPLYLRNNQLDYIDNCRYLGIKIEIYSCKSDIRRQFCKFYAKANMLIRKLSFCSDDAKVRLFKSYCTNLYCTQTICRL